jgi:peptidoglycan/xylan/chitin deacetylase (PgdA/CDA1 family)
MIELIKDFISLGFYTKALFNEQNNLEITLLYHSIADINKKDDIYKINIKPNLFKSQIDLLINSGFKDILLTFDDGFDNFYNNAFPLLKEYKLNTILFVTTDFINGAMSFNHLFNPTVRVMPLSWADIREISDSGIRIGSHTKSHSVLSSLKGRELYSEISDSKKIIEDFIGKEVKDFAYPYGGYNSYNEYVKKIVQECGYERAYLNIMGFNKASTEKYALKRIRVYNNDTNFRFKMKIKGSYNWVDKTFLLQNRKLLNKTFLK